MGQRWNFTTGEGTPVALDPFGELVKIRLGSVTIHLTKEEAERFGVRLIRCIDALKPTRRATRAAS